MVKSILKEFAIMFLLCIAILLVLGVIFYDYNPMQKVVPSKVAYTTPENVKEEISENITEFEKTNIVYEITDSDLNMYKQTKSYNPGKPDPFSLYNEAVTGVTDQTDGSSEQEPTSNGSSEQTGSTQTTKTNSTGTFFNNTGTK